jgi:acetyl-CoA carboxylase carboxyltransferase component
LFRLRICWGKGLRTQVFARKPDGSINTFELYPEWATSIITCFSRLNGYSVGVITNQPWSKAGCLDIDADTRLKLVAALDAHSNKFETRPQKKHGIMPA